ncbi:type II secretion system F family protein [Kineosporia sp. R_H_3]|uniref:type II secretion system F family protein n=1 Tax=Kineosporia sp. R_H_3 TaxID=1961848 RepID=UPI001179A476|nr:type II secretion system F family protein [Kineosporia sp. R_H_3]
MGLQAEPLLGALIGAGLAGALVLLVVGIRGTLVEPGRPPGRWTALWRRLTSPATASRLVGVLLVGLVVLLLTRWPVAAVAVAALVAGWPQLFGGLRAEQAQIARLEALVVWTESLRDTVAAHASLEQAIPASTSSCPLLLRPALTRLSGQIRARAPLDVALLSLAAELDDASADLVCAALILNVRRRGDRLAEVLTGLAVAAREELDMRRRVSAGRAGLRRGVQIVVGMTVVFAAFLMAFGGTYVRPYDTVSGQVALLVVVSMFATGFVWLRQLSAADPVTAFLARPGSPAVLDADHQRLVASLTGQPARSGAANGARQ